MRSEDGTLGKSDMSRLDCEEPSLPNGDDIERVAKIDGVAIEANAYRPEVAATADVIGYRLMILSMQCPLASR